MKHTTFDNLLIRGGRLLDPASGRDEIADVAIANGTLTADLPGRGQTIDAKGLLVCPGLMDIHVHLREPGQTHKETIESGTAAAAAGGFTFVACMPNTQPAIDSPEMIRKVFQSAQEAGLCEVGPIASITQSRAGKVLTDFPALRQAGAVALSDDGDGVEDDDVMKTAMKRARALDMVLIQHCEYKSISAGGVMHLGEVSRRLGFAGLDPRSEEAMIERDIRLCREMGGRYHIAHISTAWAVEAVRQAKAEGVPVTAEVSPHHLLLTDEACSEADPNTKMHPPLRTHADVDACRKGLCDGTIDCIATDHAPHSAREKDVGFEEAPPGIVGLETAVGLAAHAMIASGLADWPRLISWLTIGPAAVLGLVRPPIAAGSFANLTLIDSQLPWTVDPAGFLSKGSNTPFGGWRLTGRPVATLRGCRLSYHEEALSGRFSILL